MILHLPVLCGYCSAMFDSMSILVFGLQTPWGMDMVFVWTILPAEKQQVSFLPPNTEDMWLLKWQL